MKATLIAAIIDLAGALGGCVWGIEQGGPDRVVVNHYFEAMGEATEDAQRLDQPSFYYRTTFRCVAS
jgi:hypothetical protein